MNAEKIREFVSALAPVIKDFIEARTKPLEDRIRQLEMRPELKYMGVWQRAATYQPGMIVTHRGCAWIALGVVEGARPGEADNWQLMVKAGSDATRTDSR